MEFDRAVPAGSPVAPESLYRTLELERLAPADRPYIVCNFVSSIDGKAEVDGTSGALGGDGDLAVFRSLRTQTDAILAGTGTLKAEGYGALVRDPARRQQRVEQGRDPQPLGVVISRSGNVPWEIPMFDDADTRVALYLGPDAEVPATQAQTTVHPMGADGTLTAVMRSLRADHGVRSLLCEGGPGMFNALLAEDLVDELFLTFAPALVGGSGASITSGDALAGGPRTTRLVWALHGDGHLFLRYARV